MELTRDFTVNLFDQANTGCMIEDLGYRGQLLKEAIRNLLWIFYKPK